MRKTLITIAIIVGLTAVVAQAVQSQSQPKVKTPTGKPDRSADETAIQANITQFEKAYNAGDAKAVAALFTSDGQMEDKDGNQIEGRQAIEATFAEIFASPPKKRLDVTVESIRFIGAELAVEVGTTKETTTPNESPDYGRYTVLHVKRSGKWQMAFARDEEGPVHSSHEQLQPLAWLIGEWVDDGGSVVVFSSCRWSDDKNFLLQDYKIQRSGHDVMNVTQRICWDPHAKCIRSWVFDSEGGFGENVWTRDGADWLIKAKGVRNDGATASATIHLIPTGTDGYLWRSTDRVAGGEVQPPIEVKVVRKPPQPKK